MRRCSAASSGPACCSASLLSHIARWCSTGCTTRPRRCPDTGSWRRSSGHSSSCGVDRSHRCPRRGRCGAGTPGRTDPGRRRDHRWRCGHRRVDDHGRITPGPPNDGRPRRRRLRGERFLDQTRMRPLRGALWWMRIWLGRSPSPDSHWCYEPVGQTGAGVCGHFGLLL